MSRRLIVFIIVCFLVVGSILVIAKNNSNKTSEQKAAQTLYNFNNPNAASNTAQVSPTMNPNTPQVTQLKIEDSVEGTGSAVKIGDTVEVNYTGTLLNGQKFDSSLDRNQTFSFIVGGGQVIEGWDKGLVGMKVGGKRKLTIPANLGYGDQAVGPIPANSPLIFEIELVSIKPGND